MTTAYDPHADWRREDRQEASRLLALATRQSIVDKAACACQQPRRANYYVEVIYSTAMDTKDADYYLCHEHVPCEDSVVEWFREFSGYPTDEIVCVHETSVRFIR